MREILSSIALWLLAASLLFGQTTAHVQKAELSVPFGAVSGKIVVAGDHLVFIDEQKPEMSFVITKPGVRNLDAHEKIVTLDLDRPIRDRSGERSRTLVNKQPEQLNVFSVARLRHSNLRWLPSIS
ncbi:MAG: hypothetical protein L0387_09280 [Acidobacteria bacterium]|nr:hypothetical protein [Acidobacteriota bacterium]MCI0621848.1 hypothetical protein [Acidobacteriota bacterium]MCI0724039.1 hypothetical protein [Acidobacteriota bacterium]